MSEKQKLQKACLRREPGGWNPGLVPGTARYSCVDVHWAQECGRGYKGSLWEYGYPPPH